MDELIQRYANPVTSDGPLPSRLKLREIAELAYPEDGNAAFQLLAILRRCVEAGELRSVGIAFDRYLSIPPAKIEQPVIDRADFAAFINAQGFSPTGRIAGWVAGAKPMLTPRPKPGRQPEIENIEAYDYAEQLIADGMQQTRAVMEAAEQFGAKQSSIERTLRRRREERLRLEKPQ